MAREEKHYPNIRWAQFAVCNDDVTGAFEDMTRRLFTFEFLKDSRIPHSDHNNPGVEVVPSRFKNIKSVYYKRNM